ncbi:MAG: fibronectin type III domain-containing protein [Cytophagales bacterium]|nr:fibronectin type III domain-containing protein [Cytophagales bacterium]MDW8383421.1 fibronectin type III domain-containing protein [Flammeovirgaceae bacterium]
MFLRISLIAFGVCQFLAFALWAQINLTSSSNTYSENFDALSNTGTSNPWSNNSTLLGWYAQFQTGTLTQYRADNGSGTTGALYSFGTSSSSERSLGSIASNTISGTPPTPGVYYGIRIKNNQTSSPITSLSINFVLEQWRNGGSDVKDTIYFQYLLNADSIKGPLTSWSSIDTLTSLVSSSSASALDGNSPTNRITKSYTLNLTIPSGQEIWIRWVDLNKIGNDDGLAIDDFSITATFGSSSIKPEPSNHVTGLSITDSTTTSLTLSWTASIPGSQAPDGYLVKGSTSTVADPTDGVVETSGIFAYTTNTTVVISGLTPNTQYNFKVFPYTNSGTNIDYKIAGAPGVSGKTKSSATPQFMFTQYYEGKTGDNSKWLEIKNVGSTSFDANTNPLFVAYFGNTTSSTDLTTATPTPGRQYKFTGIIPAGGIILLKNGTAPPNPSYASALGDSTPACFFNGDDILVLSTDTMPGSVWTNRIDVLGSLGNWGTDTSFVRKATVTSPNINFTLSEWDGLSNTAVQTAAPNTNPRLGYHEFSSIKPEPSNHVTGLSITDSTTTSLTLSWTASIPGSQAPDGYLVKGSTSTVADPTDGVVETSGIFAYTTNTTVVISGLTPNTQYNFKVFPYTNSGTNIDYKIASAPGVSGKTKVSAPLTPVPISTIRPIQANGEPTEMGNTVVLRGTFHGANTVASTSTETNRFQYYLIDETAGVTVRNASNTNPPHVYKDFGTKFQEGDSVLLRGKVSVFRGLTQIQSIDTVILIASGRPRKTPRLVLGLSSDTIGELTESDYIELTNVTIPNTSQWIGNSTNTSGFNVNITYGPANKPLIMRIDGFTELAKKTYTEVFGTVTSGITIRGFGGQFAGTSTPYVGGYQFLPHYAADIFVSPPLKSEPSHHVTGLSITDSTTTSLTLSWTPSAPGSQAPDGYLVKGSTSAVTDPTNNTVETTGIFLYVSGNTATISGLSPNTTYNFKVYPFTTVGNNITYKTTGAPSISGKTKVGSLPLANISVTSSLRTYTQNFNTLPTSATNNQSFTWQNDNTLEGWFVGSASGSFVVRISDGSDLSSGSYGGGIYSLGQLNSTERALGSVSSGTPRWMFYGVRFINNVSADSTISAIQISYTGEQWRNTKTDPDSLIFQYKINPTQITDSITDWITVDNLRFVTPTNGGTPGGLDGNATPNRVFISHTITGINVPFGQQIWIRWVDRDNIGTDHMLGIDDLTVNFTISAAVALETEPSHHIINLAGTANSQNSITLNWQLPTGGNPADGYLIKASTTTPTPPTDGIDEPTSTLVIKAGALATSATFNGLSPATTYRFNVYPFAGSGASINYKTDGTVPSVQITTLAPTPPAIPITTIAQARQKKVGDSVAFRAIVSAGKVGTRNDIFGSYFRARYVQDTTAGIVVDAIASGGNRTKLTSLQRGDSVLIRGRLNKFDSLLQVQPFTAEDPFFITILSTGNPEPQPLKVISFDEFNLANEGRLIRIDSVLITDPRAVFAGGGSAGNFEIQKPSVASSLQTSVLRIGDAVHELVGMPVPRAMVSITGVLGNYRNTFQLQPRVPEDIQILTNTITQPTIFLSVPITGIIFENVNAGNASVAQQIGISGYKLIDSIRIRVPLHFEVDTSSSFTNPITGNNVLALPRNADSTISRSIFVRFKPTMANGAVIRANLMFSSTGAETINLPLQGQEGPKIILSTTSLPSFGIVRSGNHSSFRAYHISAQALLDSVRITAGTHFEISQDSLGTYSKRIVLPPSAFSASQRIYVRFKPEAIINSNGNPVSLSSVITHTSLKAQTAILNVIGSEGISPTMLFYEDFDTTCFPNINMFSFSVRGSEAWRCRLETGRGGLDETTGAQMSGYNGVTNVPNEDWLITRGIALPNAETFLSFYLRKEFTGRDLRVLISDNYVFGNSPKTATWDTLPSNIVSGQSANWREYRNISLEAYRNKTISIAFYYVSDSSEAARITIDIVRVTTTRVTDPTEITAVLTSLRQYKYENSTNAEVSVRTSRALPFDQKVYVSVTKSANAIYGTDYTTIPAEQNHEIIFTIPSNSTSASLVVNLLNDNIEEDFDTLYFTIRAIEGGAKIKPDSALHTFIIVDDEVRTSLKIADLRQNTLEGVSKYNLFLVANITGTVHGINYATDGKLEFRVIDISTRQAITVQTSSPFSGYTVREGDNIRVSGTVKTINGLTILEPTSIVVVGNTPTVSPRSILLSKLDEMMESDLIKLEKVTIRRILEANQGKLITLWDGKNELLMWIPNHLPLASTIAGFTNKLINVTGFVTQIDSTSPYDDGYMILPRTSSDIQVLTATESTEERQEDSQPKAYLNIYPNPALNTVFVETSENQHLQVYDVAGSLLLNIELYEGINFIDVSHLPNGVYIFKTYRQHSKVTISR